MPAELGLSARLEEYLEKENNEPVALAVLIRLLVSEGRTGDAMRVIEKYRSLVDKASSALKAYDTQQSKKTGGETQAFLEIASNLSRFWTEMKECSRLPAELMKEILKHFRNQRKEWVLETFIDFAIVFKRRGEEHEAEKLLYHAVDKFPVMPAQSRAFEEIIDIYRGRIEKLGSQEALISLDSNEKNLELSELSERLIALSDYMLKTFKNGSLIERPLLSILNIATRWFSRDKAEALINSLEQFFSRRKSFEEYTIIKARFLMGGSRYTEAAVLLRNYLEKAPAGQYADEATYLIARIAYLEKYPRMAVEWGESLLENTASDGGWREKTARLFIDIGHNYIQNAKFDEAMGILDRVARASISDELTSEALFRMTEALKFKAFRETDEHEISRLCTEALDIYNRIVSDYSNTRWAERALEAIYLIESNKFAFLKSRGLFIISIAGIVLYFILLLTFPETTPGLFWIKRLLWLPFIIFLSGLAVYYADQFLFKFFRAPRTRNRSRAIR